MMNTLAAGRFREGNSLLHRADPRSKLLMIFLLIVALFMVKSPASFFVLISLAVSTLIISGSAFRDVLRGLKPIMILVLIASFSNLVLSGGEPLSERGFLHHIPREGIFATLEMVARLIALCSGTMIMTATTPPTSLMEGGARLVQPLQRLGVPVTEITMILSLSFNFIPMVAETAQALASVYLARSARYHRGRMFRKARVCARILAPLVLTLFKKGDELMVRYRAADSGAPVVADKPPSTGFSRDDLKLAGCMLVCFCTLFYLETGIH
jgi:energy-coupling factor transport system permease protein